MRSVIGRLTAEAQRVRASPPCRAAAPRASPVGCCTPDPSLARATGVPNLVSLPQNALLLSHQLTRTNSLSFIIFAQSTINNSNSSTLNLLAYLPSYTIFDQRHQNTPSCYPFSQQSHKPPQTCLHNILEHRRQRPRARGSRTRSRRRTRTRSSSAIPTRTSHSPIPSRIRTILKDRPSVPTRVRPARQRNKRTRHLRLPIHIKVLSRRRPIEPRRAHEIGKIKIRAILSTRERAEGGGDGEVGRLLKGVDNVSMRRGGFGRGGRAVGHEFCGGRRECSGAAASSAVGRLGDIGSEPVQDKSSTGVFRRRGIRVDHDDEIVPRISRHGLVQRWVD